ncbi:Acetyl-CoA carboxylase [Orchesella cincta]|uniref:Acetyl-CoA carboxylase n=1 Tax=Orchesella cincta TaxID=48709 RepID=A0A1D2N9R0_ORCCI|nr:Acetyl-CoA carboxylase [Orchesella cincta]
MDQLPHVPSLDEMQYSELPLQLDDCQRTGIMAAFTSVEEFENAFDDLIDLFESDSRPESPKNLGGGGGDDDLTKQGLSVSISSSFSDVGININDKELKQQANSIRILNVALKMETVFDDNTLSEQFSTFVGNNRETLLEREIHCITFLALHERQFPKFFTFRSRDSFDEDRIYRHLEPAQAFQLEINRMRMYDLEALPTSNQKMHLYRGKGKVPEGQEVTDYRFFIRSIIRHSDLITKEASYEYLQNEGERLLLEAMDELEIAFSHAQAKKTDCNHIFFNFIPTVIMGAGRIEEIIRNIVLRYGPRLWKLPHPREIPTTLRLIISNQRGFDLTITMYKEENDSRTGLKRYVSYGIDRKPLHDVPVSTPYKTKDYLQPKRFRAQSNGTTYVYDFPDMFRQVLERVWEEYQELNRSQMIKPPVRPLQYIELVLDSQNRLVEQNRTEGENDVGMVAWKMKLFTPEFPKGRDIIVIANDISIGSFRVREDLLFLKASELSRSLKIPRMYLSANSGARIGLVEEIKHLFKFCWEDPSDPEKGLRYIYLTPKDYSKVVNLNSVRVQLIEDEGESRYKLTDIIGKEDGIGVENLRDADMISRETCQAYKEVVTMSLVTCPHMDIAYTLGLGNRVIQIENSHITATGYGALNKLQGREVYTSNNQLGGIQIMYNNGVSHKTERHDVEGIYSLLRWLSYFPAFKGGPLPILPSTDPVDREIQFIPTKAPYDPRFLLAGRPHPVNAAKWESGFFDHGTFDEIMKPWAQTVVCGRARLGGIPVGVIVVETRTVELNLPADPAKLDSESKTVSQAGQVWLPDSAYKIAQAIMHFSKEDLPLIIFANWRGFSGGMKDMYEQVVKFGSYIVDGLREYNQPILVYIPPFGELRGGAWVVIDPTINSKHMEMYADTDARGGILEPEGVVEIKFRMKDLLKSMHRLDPELQKLRTQLLECKPEDKVALEKNVSSSCGHFITRLPFTSRIYMTHLSVCRKRATSCHGRAPAQSLLAVEKAPLEDNSGSEGALKRWFMEGGMAMDVWEDNQQVVEWLINQLDTSSPKSVVQKNLHCLRRDSVVNQAHSLFKEHPEFAIESVVRLLQHMNPQQRSEAIRAISKIEDVAPVEQADHDAHMLVKPKFISAKNIKVKTHDTRMFFDKNDIIITVVCSLSCGREFNIISTQIAQANTQSHSILPSISDAEIAKQMRKLTLNFVITSLHYVISSRLKSEDNHKLAIKT